jgi:hypothetical protein
MIMKTLTVAAIGLLTLTLTLISYSYIQKATADVCLSCWLKQKAQDIKNNQNIPDPHRSEISTKLNEKVDQLNNHFNGRLGCSPWDPRGC